MNDASFGSSLYRYYEDLSSSAENARHEELAALKTAEDAGAHVLKCRERLRRVLMEPEFPAGDTPAEVTGQICRNGVLVDKVLYEVRPGVYGTGLFFRPEDHCGDLPGVIGSCGHSFEGKAAESYQSFAFGLAAKGFGVFLHDPPGQGERHLHIPAYKPTYEHAVMGKALIAGGIQPASLFISDGRKAISYLLSRPEIRPGKVAATGHSGGGQMTYYLFGMDDRVEIAACSCHMNTMRTVFRDEIATDPESSIIGLLAAGSDRPDFAIAGAPKPLMLLGAEQDMINLRGLLTSWREISHIYRLLGKEGSLRICTAPGPHAFHRKLREAMYGFFGRHYFGGIDPAEPELQLLTRAECQATPEGETILLPASRGETEFVRSEIRKNAAPMTGLPQMGAFLRETLHLPSRMPDEAPDYRVPRPIVLENTRISRYLLLHQQEKEAAPVMFLSGSRSEPLVPAVKNGAMLYVSHLNACREMPQPQHEGQLVFALDVRGTGASRPLNGGSVNEKDYFSPLGREYFFECTSRVLDTPFSGGRVRDICAALALLRQAGAVAPVLYGYGLGGVAAAYTAAAYELPISKLILRQVPESLDKLLGTGLFRMPQSCIPFGMLRHFDLSELYAALGRHYDLTLETAADIPADPDA